MSPTLQALGPTEARPLPVHGKIAACVGQDRVAVARLELPGAATRELCASELAPVMWLTVGLLASDGFALQVRCHLLLCIDQIM